MKRIMRIGVLVIAIFAFSGCSSKSEKIFSKEPKINTIIKVNTGNSLVKTKDFYGTKTYSYNGVILNPLDKDAFCIPRGKERKFKAVKMKYRCINNKEALKYKFKPTIILDTNHNNFKTELLYQGVQGDTLRLTYREFIGSLIRPAFFQDLTYKLNKDKPTTINFKNIKIKIYEATNNYIKYEVLSYTND